MTRLRNPSERAVRRFCGSFDFENVLFAMNTERRHANLIEAIKHAIGSYQERYSAATAGA